MNHDPLDRTTEGEEIDWDTMQAQSLLHDLHAVIRASSDLDDALVTAIGRAHIIGLQPLREYLIALAAHLDDVSLPLSEMVIGEMTIGELLADDDPPPS